MKERILVISSRFFQSGNSFSERLYPIVEALAGAGYAVSVLCGDASRRQTTEKKEYTVLRFDAQIKKRRAVLDRDLYVSPRLSRFFGAIRRVLITHRFRNDTHKQFSKMTERLSKEDVALSSFDVLLCEFPFAANLLTALWVKERCPEIRILADYKIPLEALSPLGIRRYVEKLHHRVLLKADVLIGATKGYLSMLERSYFGGQCIHHYSGILPPVVSGQTPEALFSGRFSIYAGDSVLDKAWDACTVFSAVASLLHEGRIKREKIALVYCGSERSAVEEKLRELEIETLLMEYDTQTFKSPLFAQRASQLLVCGAFDSAAYHGVVPDSFFEQLSLGVPIVGAVRGTGTESELCSLIRSLRVGVCYEEGGGQESFEKLKKYLLESYVYYFARGKALFEPDEKKLQALRQEEQIASFLKLIKGELQR